MSDKQYFKVKKTWTVGEVTSSIELQHPIDLCDPYVVASVYDVMLTALDSYEFELGCIIDEENV